MKEIIRDRKKYYLYYTIIYLVVMLIVFLPFLLNGKTFIADNDTIAQHYPYMVKIRDFYRYNIKALIMGKQLKFFDFNTFLGLDIVQTYNYYGYGNPLFLLLIFVPKNMMPFMYQIMVLVFIYLGGGFFSEYCFYHNIKEKNIMIGVILYIVSPLAIATMDQLCFVLLVYQIPLAWLGFDLLLDKNIKSIFVGALVIISLSGFYMLYVITICLILYGFYKAINNNNNIKSTIIYLKEKIATSLICYIIAILLVSPIFIVNLVGFFNSFRSGRSKNLNLLFYNKEIYDKELLSFIFYFPGSFFTVNIAVLIMIYMMKKKKETKWLIITGIIMVLSQISVVGFIFNGFAYPSNRWFMVVSFYFCILCVQFFDKYNINAKQLVLIILISLIQPLIFSYLFSGADECFSVKKIKNISNRINQESKINRVDLSGNGLSRENAYCESPSTWIYTSMIPKKICDTMLKFGNKELHSTSEIYGLDGRPELMALFNVDEYYGADDAYKPDWFVKSSKGNTYINTLSLPFGYTYKNIIYENDVEDMNEIDRSWVALRRGIVDNSKHNKNDKIEGISKKIPFISKNENKKYMLKFDEIKKSQIYVVLDGSEGGKIEGKINNKDCFVNDFSFFTKNNPWFIQREKLYINAGYYDKISELTIIFEESYDKGVELYAVDVSNYKSYLKELSEKHLDNVKYRVNMIEGSVSLNEDRTMCIAVPNLKGWKAYVDEKEVDIYTVNYMFIGIDIPKGNHVIKIKYKTPLFDECCFLSGITMLVLICYGVIRRKRKIRDNKVEG
ncbi:membrane protein YfhO [Eubacterium uniforme]|uniref:Membrane protein YfhO n=1 Tax=Eubacterium uniforme TaxID=39495 RepID=A0A1T4VNA7_9FIRM|nr:YfhO family protein [Eubacterium uniforme]SKA66419.1 membrane protein YfhO [Eubacterium uniforme]